MASQASCETENGHNRTAIKTKLPFWGFLGIKSFFEVNELLQISLISSNFENASFDFTGKVKSNSRHSARTQSEAVTCQTSYTLKIF